MSFEEYTNAVKIDDCHRTFIHGLISAHKPARILELGFGSGKSTQSIHSAVSRYGIKSIHFVVDNWMDFNGYPPKESNWLILEGIQLITSNEKEFIFSCKETFDFILSDADHGSTHEWFDHVYHYLLNDGGILIYHDVCKGYPGLAMIVEICKQRGLRYVVFNKNSLPDEHCDRGLLVIFRP